MTSRRSRTGANRALTLLEAVAAWTQARDLMSRARASLQLIREYDATFDSSLRRLSNSKVFVGGLPHEFCCRKSLIADSAGFKLGANYWLDNTLYLPQVYEDGIGYALVEPRGDGAGMPGLADFIGGR